MKVRKKPVILDAEQFLLGKVPRPDGVVAVLVSRQNENFCLGPYTSFTDPEAYNANVGFGIMCPGGWLRVRHEDWIITGHRGEKYLCKPDVFEDTYETVSDPDPAADPVRDGALFDCDH